MEFLDKLVIPQNGANLQLLNFLLVLAKVIFIIYSGTLLGSWLMSYIFYSQTKKSPNNDKLQYAKNYIDLITPNKTIAFGLGLVPFLAIITSYTQLMHKTGSPVIGYLIPALILYFIGLIGAYAYKHSLHLQTLLPSQGSDGNDHSSAIHEGDAYHYAGSMKKLAGKSGFWGILSLLLSLWIFVTASTIAADTSSWQYYSNFINFATNLAGIVTSLHFLTASLALTGIAFVVKYFIWDKDTYNFDSEWSRNAIRLNSGITLAFTIAQPFFLVLSIILTPKTAVSYFMFASAMIVFITAFVVSHIIYTMLKNNSFGNSVPAFYIIIFLMAFIIIKEQSAFAVSNKQNIANLAEEYNRKAAEELMAKSGGPVANGEELYQAKCTACHKFDEKLVGPPHKLVLKKYIGNRNALAGFILNPTKIDPAYPPMPIQGLKKFEAEAIADYMLEFYGPKVQ